MSVRCLVNEEFGNCLALPSDEVDLPDVRGKSLPGAGSGGAAPP